MLVAGYGNCCRVGRKRKEATHRAKVRMVEMMCLGDAVRIYDYGVEVRVVFGRILHSGATVCGGLFGGRSSGGWLLSKKHPPEMSVGVCDQNPAVSIYRSFMIIYYTF